MLWGATSGVLVTIALSGVPLFKMDVLNKTPLVRLENVLNTCFTSANKHDVPMLLCCSLLCFLSVSVCHAYCTNALSWFPTLSCDASAIPTSFSTPRCSCMISRMFHDHVA